MKQLIIIITIFSFNTIFGQQTTDWLNRLENPKYTSDDLKKENFNSEYLKYDFSTLLIPKKDFIGYIGTEFRRIQIYFTSICKDLINKEIYEVNGISVVGDNICDFTGTIKIEQVREFKTMHFGIDNKFENAGFKSQGILIGKYSRKKNTLSKNLYYSFSKGRRGQNLNCYCHRRFC